MTHCTDCGTALQANADGSLYCPKERQDTEDWRADWAEQVRRYVETPNPGVRARADNRGDEV